MQAAAIDEQAKKMERYRNLVQLLPTINAKTLKKLMSHLVAIASHSGILYYNFLVFTPFGNMYSLGSVGFFGCNSGVQNQPDLIKFWYFEN